MKDEEKIHEILKHALVNEWKPTDQLNNSLIKQIMEEKQIMNEKKMLRKRKLLPSLAFAAMLVLVMGVTCFAAVKLLTPKQVAENIGDTDVAKAFEGKDAIKINQTVTEGGYKITLLGVAGSNALANLENAGLELQNGSTYAVVAIEKEDGTPMVSPGDEADDNKTFFVSPLIKGLRPWEYNIASMNGSYGENIIDGVLYRIIKCDNVEVFADQGIYLCVSDTTFYDTNAYNYDESTGEITVKDNYSGINVLYDLPIDTAKADSEKAARYLQQLEEQWK